ncbi:hypothetical protein [Flexivirga meconopsidis]|uniref:hypothetical protein n=1 Tax=Flexivirga meconopsidis TaxID=2977121 RepID=UPI0022407FF4|nr:hypothetical protein [Flexivirga meconopsidis]
MPFRRNRNPGDREFDGLYGARTEDAPDDYPEDYEYDDADYDEEDPHPADSLGFGDDDYVAEEHKPRGPVRRTLGCLIPVAIVGGIAYGGYAAYQHLVNNFGSPSCKVVANGFDYQWDPEQTANASTIVDVGVFKKGLPARAATVATTTALQESKLRNLTYGDLDSLGLFQQRPSQGWGTADQIQDPIYASGSFYNALTKIPEWQSLSIGAAAQEVQRSGYPDAYNDHETQGETITAVMAGTATEGVGCRLDPAKSAKTPAQVVTELQAQSALVARPGDGSVTFTGANTATAWAVASWAVAHADADGIQTVTVGDRAWERHRGKDGWKWQNAKRATSGVNAVRIDLAQPK